MNSYGYFLTINWNKKKNQPKKQKNNSAFTILELSITIAIIALIAGAALTSLSLLENAKMRRILTEKENYELAISGFCTRYQALPGDYSKATNEWGSATVNGDDNGQINFLSSSVYESYRAWQHMTLAQMVNGVFTGTQTTSAPILNKEIPESIIPQAGFLLDYNLFGFSNLNILILGKPLATTISPVLVGGAISPKQAQIIDGKGDDGIPNSGKIHGRDGNGVTSGNCYNSANNIYNLSNENKDCTIGFRIDSIETCTNN
jgi:prepilin-type N-terminal cleavage/methylation domain-containing protein